MTPLLMHQFWAFVEEIHPQVLQSLDDVSLEEWLIQRLSQEQYLDHGQADAVSSYIRSRLPLIREIAYTS